ncbi:MAG: hypothetical protein AAF561_10685 [Planctomycetota bacterium]
MTATPDPKEEAALILRLTADRARQLLDLIRLDPADRNHGGFVDPRTGYACTRGSIYTGTGLLTAYLDPRMRDVVTPENMLPAVEAHLEFIARRQYPDGTIGLGVAGVGSPNEVGFTLPGVCRNYRACAESDVPGRDRILDVLGDYIRRGAEAVRRGFPYTSNHRWTPCCGALASVQRVFPDPANLEVIDEYLSDGIDIDDDGLYFEERSPNYNTVANWGLIYLAEHLGRRDLLELVVRNLHFNLLMRQPSGEAETMFSHRQDRGAVGKPWGEYHQYRRVAIETGDGTLAAAADLLFEELRARTIGRQFDLPLLDLIDHPKFADPVERQPLPTRFDRRMVGQLHRFRHDRVAFTAVADTGGHFFDVIQSQSGWGGINRSNTLLDFHVGQCVIDAVKVTWGGGEGSLRPTEIEYLDDRHLRLSYDDPGSLHTSHFRPEGKRHQRRIPINRQASLDVRWTEQGDLTLHVAIDGWPDMPVCVQLFLRETCKLFDGASNELVGAEPVFTDGGAYRLLGPGADDGIEIRGLPASEHMILIGGESPIGCKAEDRCRRLVCGLFTPTRIDFTLQADPKP